LEASVQEMGRVKWYNAAKGFGFIVLDGGGNDVFVHVSALQRAGIMGLSEGQRVYVGVAEGQKGPEPPQSKWRIKENGMHGASDRWFDTGSARSTKVGRP
jgi:cold shock CspA family protein